MGRCDHFHSAAIASKYPIAEVEQFIKNYEALGPSGRKQEVLAALLIDAHIANAKYRRVTRSIRLLAVSTIFGVLYTLTIQF